MHEKLEHQRLDFTFMQVQVAKLCRRLGVNSVSPLSIISRGVGGVGSISSVGSASMVPVIVGIFSAKAASTFLAPGRDASAGAAGIGVRVAAGLSSVSLRSRASICFSNISRRGSISDVVRVIVSRDDFEMKAQSRKR